jgi:glycine/D-amino acid oxidase-like deaminating enzyme
MQTSVLIVGQGIAGTMLAWFLEKAGVSFLVLDENHNDTASKIASGIINPVTGRRIVKTWMIDDLMPFAVSTYEEMGRFFKTDFVTETPVVNFFPTPQMHLAFKEELNQQAAFLQWGDEEEAWRHWFYYDFGYGLITPAYTVQTAALVMACRQYLLGKNWLIEDRFETHLLEVSSRGIRFKDITCKRLVFCNGVAALQNPWFKNLPFAPNKGEALIIEAPDLPRNRVFKKGISISPLGHDLFWVGSNYTWDFTDDLPTAVFRQQTEAQLKSWLKSGFKTIDHKAALRPANVERRPFAGFHPVQNNIGILNGLGAKGLSLAPWFARELSNHITDNRGLLPEADIARFKKVLLR